MEQLYPLLTLFSGVTIVLLGSFLFASERELKRKRRELDESKHKPSADSDTSIAGEHPELRSLEERNTAELLQEISVLSRRLEEGERMSDERQNDQHLLLSAQSEKQQLQERIDSLKIRLETSENHLVASNKRIHEALDLSTELQIEIAGLKQHLATKDNEILELQSRTLEQDKISSENQTLRAENQHLLEEVTKLQERLNEVSTQHDAIAEQHAQLQLGSAESKQQTDELTAKNKRLQEDVDMTSSKLTRAERTAEEFRLLHHQAHLDNQQLQEANHKLEREIEETREQLEALRSELERRVQQDEDNRTQLNAREKQWQDLARQYQEVSDRCARLEAEAADYRQQPECSQLTAQKLASATEQRAGAESREMNYQEQQQQLQAVIADLERELSEARSQTEVLEKTHKRLQETERICAQLGAENRRLGEEIARWQERLAVSEENQRQVSMLRRQLDILQTEHAKVMDKNRHMQELTATRPSHVESHSGGPILTQHKLNAVTEVSSVSTVAGEARGPFDTGEPATRTQVPYKVRVSHVAWSWIARNRHFGAVFAGAIVLVIAGAIVMKILSTETRPAPVAPAPEATSVEHVAGPNSKTPIQTGPRLRGAFRTIRPTQVFSGPTENSALIANIGEGMKLNVVDSRNGWLEIRSRHGRPPGFIRQEAAVRIGAN
jgi:hypothetical protein